MSPVWHGCADAGQVGGGGGEAQRFVVSQQQLAVIVAEHRGVAVSPGTQGGVYAGQLLPAAPPMVPHVAAESVPVEQAGRCAANCGLLSASARHSWLPVATVRQVVGESPGIWISSSACPSQQSSNPRASNSWSPDISNTGSV